MLSFYIKTSIFLLLLFWTWYQTVHWTETEFRKKTKFQKQTETEIETKSCFEWHRNFADFEDFSSKTLFIQHYQQISLYLTFRNQKRTSKKHSVCVKSSKQTKITFKIWKIMLPNFKKHIRRNITRQWQKRIFTSTNW